MKEKHELRALPRVLFKGLVVIGITFLMAFGLNFAMQNFLDAEVASVQAANARAAERAAKLEEALLAAENEAAAAVLKAQIAVEKAEQQENFYQRYKNRDNYQAYGQFYEMFFNTYSADTILIGTSHAEYGINPLYLEEEMPDRSFFNFALDGTNPGYYLDWWEVFLESGYSMPDTIVYCVDWFMFDRSWLWRRITTDSNPSGALTTIRQLKAAETGEDAAETTAPDIKLDAGEIIPEETVSLPEETPQTEQQLSIFDLDGTIEYLFNRIPIIYARDRIPEMIAFYLNGGMIASAEEDDITDELAAIDALLENMELPEMPVYEHEYLVDKNGSITSSYYKGHIVREKNYTGSRSNRSYKDQEDQWAAFEKLLGLFMENDIHVVFVEVPEYIKGRYINGDRNSTVMEDNNARIREIGEKYGITFLNYNEELASSINDDYTNFFDWGHLNGQGSVTFSQVLAKDLKAYFASADAER